MSLWDPQRVWECGWLIGLLVIVRITATCQTLPFLVELPVPARVRMFLAGALSLLIAPVAMVSSRQPPTGAWPELVLREAVVGMALGLSVGILLAASRTIAAMADMGSMNLLGSHLADAGAADASASGRLFTWIGLLAFLAVRGDQQVMSALLDSFRQLPLGGKVDAPQVTDGLLRLMTASLMIGWRVALPVTCAGFFSLCAVAILGRLSPAARIMLTAIPALQLASLAMLMLSLGGIVYAYSRELAQALNEWLPAVLRSLR